MYKNFILNFSNRSLLAMFLLGISCGFPLALIASTLKTWLADSMQISFKEVAAFSFILIPYSFKFLWSPFIDSIELPWLKKTLGHRRAWLLLSQLMLIGAILGLSHFIHSKNLPYIIVLAVCVAFFSATQDIITDAYRIELLSPELQGSGIMMYTYGYRLGLYISGAGLLVAAHKIGWGLSYYFSSLLAAIGIIGTLISKNPNHIKHYKDKAESYSQYFINMVVNPFKDFTKLPTWYYVIAFIILFKLGDAVAGNLTQPFLRSIGFSLSEIAFYLKTFSIIGIIIGAFLGSIISRKCSPTTALVIAGTLQMLSNLMFIYQNHVGANVYALTGTVLVENICGAIGDVIFIKYLSNLCSFKFAATQYALISSFATIGRNVVSGTVGSIVDNYGWDIFFMVSAIVAIPGLLMAFKVGSIKSQQTS